MPPFPGKYDPGNHSLHKKHSLEIFRKFMYIDRFSTENLTAGIESIRVQLCYQF